MDPLSGDVQGYAPSHPVDPSAPPEVPPVAAPSAGKQLPAQPAPAPESQPPAEDASPAPITDATDPDAGRAPASADDSDNPFAQAAGMAPVPAAPQDDSDNPFAAAAGMAPPAPTPRAPLAKSVQTNLQPLVDNRPAPTDTGDALNPHLGAGQPLTNQDFAHDLWHGLNAGYQNSVTGLGLRMKTPDNILPEHADMALQIGSMIGQFAGDTPAMVMGMIGGASAGTVEAPVVGTLSGGVAGAWFAPGFIRKGLTEYYEKNGLSSDRRSFTASLMAAGWEGIKNATAGLAGGKAGEAVAPVAGALASKAAELATMTTTGSALEGRLPKPEEFLYGGLMMAGMHSFTHVTGIGAPAEVPTDHEVMQGKLQNIYGATGEHPADVVQAAQSDVGLLQDLVAGNMQEPAAASPNKLVHEVEKQAPEDVAEGAEPKTLGVRQEVVPDEEAINPPRDEAPKPYNPLVDNFSNLYGEQPTPEEPSFKEAAAEGWNKFYKQSIDWIDPATRAVDSVNDQLTKAGKPVLSEEMNPASKAYQFASHSGTVDQVLKLNTLDAKTNTPNGEGLYPIFKDVASVGTANEFKDFLVAQRGLEKIGLGFEPKDIHANFTVEKANQIINGLKGKYGALADRYYAFNGRMMDYARDSGLISEDQHKAITTENQKYVPFGRVMDFDEFDPPRQGMSSTAMKAFEGSERDILDPLKQTTKNVQAIIRAAKINEVRNLQIDALRKANLIETEKEGSGIGLDNASKPWLREVKNTEAIRISGDELKAALAKQGLSSVTDLEDATIFRKTSAPLADNEFAVKVNGQRKVFTGDPDLIDTMKRLDGDKTAMSLMTKFAKIPAAVTRFGTVGNPVTGIPFALGHIAKATTEAWMASETSNALPWHMIGNAAELMGKKSEAYNEWVRNGGAVGSMFDVEKHYSDAEIWETPSIRGSVWNVVKKAWNAPHVAIQLSDNLTRFTEFKLAREQGLGPVESAQLGRDVIPDYAMAGLQRSVWRSLTAFVGAHVNSIANMSYQVANNPGYLAKMGVMGGMSAALWYINKDDKAIQARPQWEKDTNWMFNISRYNGTYDNDKDQQQATIVKIPKPWAPGILAASGMEHAMAAYFKDNPDHLADFGQSLMASVFPELVPTIAQPVMDQLSNRNRMTGRPLVPEYKQKLLPEMQYTPYTSEVAKGIGKLIGYVPGVRSLGPSEDPLSSPIVVDNYIKMWTGSLGQYALRLGDNLSRSKDSNPITAAVTGDRAEPWERSIFAKRFFAHYPDFADQNVDDFYRNVNASQTAYASAKAADKAGDYAGAEAIRQAHPEYQVKLNSIVKGISNARQMYDKIQTSDLPAAEKSQQLSTVLFQIGSMAKQGNQMMSTATQQAQR